MPGFGAAVRLFTRSTSARSAASYGVKTSPFRLSATKPLSHRIFRCPVELSVCLETVQPFHTVTASALMTSVLIVSRRSYGLLPEDYRETVACFLDFSALAISCIFVVILTTCS